MNELRIQDLNFICSRIPRDVRALMIEHNSLMLAGGFIRSIIEGSKPKDIDLFGPNKDTLKNAAMKLSLDRGAKMHETDNAITVVHHTRTPAQFITRWMYDDPENLVREFDFTVCQAVVWYGPDKKEKFNPDSIWQSVCSPDFYADLAAHRLVYTSPQREESPGGSMLRVRKFLSRGYNIQPSSLAKVIARLMMGVGPQAVTEEDKSVAIAALLYEVDPLTIIDGMDVINDHEEVNQG